MKTLSPEVSLRIAREFLDKCLFALLRRFQPGSNIAQLNKIFEFFHDDKNEHFHRSEKQ